jgi:hypothetical protein
MLVQKPWVQVRGWIFSNLFARQKTKSIDSVVCVDENEVVRIGNVEYGIACR